MVRSTIQRRGPTLPPADLSTPDVIRGVWKSGRTCRDAAAVPSPAAASCPRARPTDGKKKRSPVAPHKHSGAIDEAAGGASAAAAMKQRPHRHPPRATVPVRRTHARHGPGGGGGMTARRRRHTRNGGGGAPSRSRTPPIVAIPIRRLHVRSGRPQRPHHRRVRVRGGQRQRRGRPTSCRPPHRHPHRQQRDATTSTRLLVALNNTEV